MIYYLDESLMEQGIHPLTVKHWDTEYDPITDYKAHDDALLNSALNLPKQTFDNKDLYPTITKKAAILYYALIKNHAFENGNKRIAVMSLYVFLGINDRKLTTSSDKLYRMTLAVAVSDPKKKESVLKEIEEMVIDAI